MLQGQRNLQHFFDGFTFLLDTLGKNYTLVDAQIHLKYNEQRINFVHLCIQKLIDNVSVCRIFPQCLLYILIYLHIMIFYEAKTLPVHSSVPANNKETIK